VLAFVLSLLVTLVFLGLVVLTGLRARRKLHIPLVVLALLSLGATVWCAERLGEHYDLQSAGRITEIHLLLAKVSVCAYLLPVATGLLSLRRRRMVSWHGRLAFLALGLTVASAVTGTAMLLLSDPVDAAPMQTLE
jgi:hypothetical protein